MMEKFSPSRTVFLLLTVLILLPTSSAAKKRKPKTPATLNTADTVIYDTAERMPLFRGKGDVNDFAKWMSSQMRYPREAFAQKAQGKVLAQFVIEPTGELSNLTILSSPHPALSREVIRILKLSPRWTPGMAKDRPVRVHIQVPVRFTLEGGDLYRTPRNPPLPGSSSSRSSQRGRVL